MECKIGKVTEQSTGFDQGGRHVPPQNHLFLVPHQLKMMSKNELSMRTHTGQGFTVDVIVRLEDQQAELGFKQENRTEDLLDNIEDLGLQGLHFDPI